jgi:hypothetical protein
MYPQWKQWLVVVPIMVVLSGCTTLTQNETQRVVASELSRQYLGLHEQYLALERNLPQSQQGDLERIARPMDRARQLLITYNELVIAGQDDTAKATDVRMRVQSLIADLAQQIADIALEQIYVTE